MTGKPGRSGAGSVVIGRVEIPSGDPLAAAEFYRRALGWQGRAVPWEGGDYVSLSPAAGVGAGLTDAETLGSERPLAVLHVENEPLAERLAKIVAAGGSLDGEPREIPGMGTFARFRDPEGHLFGLWSAAESDSPPR